MKIGRYTIVNMTDAEWCAVGIGFFLGLMVAGTIVALFSTCNILIGWLP